MKRLRRYISVLLCLVVLFCGSAVTASAEEVILKPVITVSNHSAVPGDRIIVNISVSQNPGIMAMTFTVAYDSSVLSYESYRLGVLSDYLVVDHPDKGYVSFVNCESMNRRKNGTLFALIFNVKDNAQTGEYGLNIMHIHPEQHGASMNGCFANWIGSKFAPIINNGTLSIAYTGTNCTHRYGEWETTVPAMCEVNGARTHTCTICGHSSTEDIAPIGHSFQDFWTVDREATADTSGVMSRHCERCAKTTDKVTFNLDDANNNDFTNSQEQEIKPDQWDKLQEITDKNKAEEPTPPEVTPPLVVAPQDIELPESADSLIASTEVPMGIAGRIYRLFFGTQSRDGIVSLINNSVPKNIQWLFENPLLIFVFLGFTFII